MGRHSARDDDDGVVMTFTAPVAGAPPQRGRHARHPEDADEATQPLETPHVRGEFAEQDTIQFVLPKPPPSPPEAPPAPDAPDVAPQPAPAPASPAAPAAAAPPAAPDARPSGKRHHSTAADLALLRKHSDIRARVIAAAVVPFILYTVVIYLLTAFDVYFIWVWIPLVSAGVLAGSFLDSAHRRLERRG